MIKPKQKQNRYDISFCRYHFFVFSLFNVGDVYETERQITQPRQKKKEKKRMPTDK